MRICGVDEAGRGPVIGPLVVAGVMVEDDTILRDMGVRDSKKLSSSKREDLASRIKQVAVWKETLIPARDIDVLREKMTINVLETKLFATIIENLRPDVAYVDSADANARTFRDLILRELHFNVEVISEHRADVVYPVVSAASIIAKSRREAEVRKIQDEIGQPIGSGYPSDPNTISFLKDWVERRGELPPHTRRSWETARRLISSKRLRKLENCR